MKKKLVRDTTTDNKTYNAISKDLYASVIAADGMAPSGNFAMIRTSAL